MTIQEELDSGLSHHQAGRLVEAQRIYQRVLALQPDNAGALHLLGVLAMQTGKSAAAIELIRQAIRLSPDFSDAHYNLGKALTEIGQFDEAVVCCRQVVRLGPGDPEAHNNLGIALKNAGRVNEAIACYQQAARIDPDYSAAYANLGNVLMDMGRLNEAIASHRDAVRLNPESAEEHYNFGNALRRNGQLDEAAAAYRQALRLKPGFAEAIKNLGNALRGQGRTDEAIARYLEVISIDAHDAETHSNLGNAYKDLGQLDEAIAAYREAIRLKPDYAVAHSNLVYALLFHPGCDAKMIHEEHRRWNQQHAEPLGKFIQPHSNSRDPDRRLRIGYISADFRTHSVSQFLLPLFLEHDPGICGIFCYSDVLKTDGVTERLRACVDEWQNIVGWSDERVAHRIREDKIDILVDLAGHTGGNRLRVFARKPAPVQVSYLGYPGTTGLSEMDYRMTDALADPPGETESPHTEKLLRLPVCNWCFGEPDEAPPVGPLPAKAVGSIQFGTFNNFAKASPGIMDLWAAILIAMPSSRLFIKSRGLGEKSVRERIHRHFASRGVQADRLKIRGHERDIASHLAAYSQMDIALDTFPYHGTATTCEALWMGVPVVTLAGQAHVSRVGASLLSNVGLPELIARSAAEYLSIAVGLAKDLPRLAEIRRTLRSRMQESPLMDAPRFARDMEAAYRQMWRNWCAGRDE